MESWQPKTVGKVPAYGIPLTDLRRGYRSGSGSVANAVAETAWPERC